MQITSAGDKAFLRRFAKFDTFPARLRRGKDAQRPCCESHEGDVVLTTQTPTLRILTLALGLQATIAFASPPDAVRSLWLATQAPAQFGKKAKAGPEQKHEVDALLSRARTAMKDGNFETADSLITRAEAIPVEYGLFHVGDTPKKCRQELDSRRRSSGEPSLPSRSAKPGNQETPEGTTADPFRARTSGSQDAPSGVNDRNLPSMDRADAAASRSPFGRSLPTTPPTLEQAEAELPAAAAISAKPVPSDARQKSDAHLLAARKALAVGDVRTAKKNIDAARSLGVEYGYHEDTPVRVDSLIRKHEEVMAQEARRETEGWQRSYAELLMEQASQLVRWKEYDDAERLARDASQLKVNYGPFEAKPATLLERIAAERTETSHGAKVATAPSAPKPLSTEASTDTAEHSGGKQQCLALLKQARESLDAGQLDEAEQLAKQAEGLKIADREFGPKDDRPWLVALEVQKARTRSAGVTTAGGATPPGERYPTTNAGYDRNADATRNRPASAKASMPIAQEVVPANRRTPMDRLPIASPAAAAGESEGYELIRAGEQALRDRNVETALDYFKQANAFRDELDPVAAQRLQDHLQMLSIPAARQLQTPPKAELIDAATAEQQLAIKQLSAEITRQQMAARKLMESDPRQAVRMIEDAKANLEGTAIDPQVREALSKRLDVTLSEVNKYIEKNRAQLALDESNRAVRDEVRERRTRKVEVDERLARLVDDFNKLMDEQRYAEAEVIAKRANELDPDNPVVKQLVWVSSFARRTFNNRSIESEQERGALAAWESVDESGVPWDDRESIRFMDAKKWEPLTKSRRQRFAEGNGRRSEKELQIERKLRTPVSANFRDRPLTEVLDQLGKLADVNIHLDPQGLVEEGVASETPVTIDLREEISLRSALNLILEPLRLSYVIKDEVLKITSEQMRDGEVYTVTYSVADLVIPIPNFVPNSSLGLAGALRDAQGNLGMGAYGGFAGQSPTAVLASAEGNNASGMINPAVLAQMQGGGGSRPASGMPASIGGLGGPGGMGGGVKADFDSLIELITTTVQPTTWDEVGGPGSVAPFETNLSLVISQTQEVHEQIKDLLEQLRRMQDLQVTIEVRFITLNDSFFERIGVDFDFDIQSHIPADNADRILDGLPAKPSATVGLLPPATGAPFPNFTSNLDIPFRQESFGLALPQFGQPVDVAQFGFAILSDIEAYFLVAAAQGDRRSNVLQAPKVTLFNGQQAFVSDTSQTPFVISVIPVVGDFAAAQQPVIVVLNEGTFLTVQAVISNDRRFVRLTVVPFFSRIGDVEEFQFTGSTTTKKSSSNSNQGDDTSNSDDTETTNEGVTVQLPTFSFVTVTTTVSVPDGGTVLLGGIKRLSEGRNEFGVPILSKLPYVSRLFKNVGIGRETQSLMMMVTPRIIIQEEEEERLGIQPQP
jgi:general secretion pathway protein D